MKSHFSEKSIFQNLGFGEVAVFSLSGATRRWAAARGSAVSALFWIAAHTQASSVKTLPR
jgi:hypothetical protein